MADLGHFSPPYNPNNGLTRHDQQTAAKLNESAPFAAMPLFILAGSLVRLLCQDEIAFLELLTRLELLHQLAKAGKRKELH